MIKKEISTREEARDFAIEWQHRASEQSLSYGELADWGAYFEELATRFDLREEFIENGIVGAPTVCRECGAPLDMEYMSCTNVECDYTA